MSHSEPLSRLRIGLIGVGSRGTWLAHEAERSGLAKIVAAYDPDPVNAGKWQQQRQVHLPLVSRKELLALSLDGVIVASPDHCHLQDASDAMHSGKPVLLEKPMAIGISDCDTLLNLQKTTGQPLQIGFNLRFHPLYLKMREIVQSGDIGRLTSVWIRHFVGRGGDYYFHDWHGQRDRSTGLLLQKATHDIDMLHFISGAYTRRLTALGQLTYFGGERDNGLTCTTCNERDTCVEANVDPQNVRTQCAFRNEIDVEDNQIVLMELENGVIAHYSQCHFTPDYHRSYVFIGTKGRIESFEPMLRVEGWQKETRIEVLYRHKPTARQTFRFDLEEAGHGGADLAMLTYWFHSLRSGNFDRENPIAARQSVAVGCLATESLRTDNAWQMVLPLPQF